MRGSEAPGLEAPVGPPGGAARLAFWDAVSGAEGSRDFLGAAMVRVFFCSQQRRIRG